MIGANALPGILASFLNGDNSPTLEFVISLVGWAIQMAVSLGIIGVALKIYDRKKAAYSDLFKYSRLILPYAVSSIAYSLIVVAGLILLIVPGIIWAIKFQYFSYFMVDRGMGPIDALKASAKITKGVKSKLFFFQLIVGLINIVGVLFFLVGLFITIPTTLMAETYVYRKLSEKKSSKK